MNGLQNESQDVAGRNPQIRVCRLCAVLLPLAVVVTAGLLSWGYFDVANRVERWLRPPLVRVTGRIFLNGEPLRGAEVFTKRVNMKGGIAQGFTDADGRFTLETDVDGDRMPGSYLGEHLVKILKLDPKAPAGPAKPPLITPPEDAEFETTPLRMSVGRNPEENYFEFNLLVDMGHGESKMAGKKGGD